MKSTNHIYIYILFLYYSIDVVYPSGKDAPMNIDTKYNEAIIKLRSLCQRRKHDERGVMHHTSPQEVLL